METTQFIQLLGKSQGGTALFNLGLVLYKKEVDLDEVSSCITDSNQVTTVEISTEFNSTTLSQIVGALMAGRIVKVLIKKDLNEDLFMLINYLSQFAKIKFEGKEQEVAPTAKMFVCFKSTDYDKSRFDFGNMFYPIIRL